jgi:hypothetical protein
MAQNAFQHGSSSLEDFYGWMNERHAIFRRRFVENKPKPWTEDKIMLEYKFTNVFRELDKGTIALRKMEKQTVQDFLACEDPERAFHLAKQIVFNTFWYRTFNWYEHAEKLGMVAHYDQMHDYFMDLHRKGKRIFTGAHMVRGDNGEVKVFPYLRLLKQVWDTLDELTGSIVKFGTMENAYWKVREYHLVGPFNAYELVCDWRWNVLEATDALTWGSIGPGAARGLQRLGLDVNVKSMIDLWCEAPNYLAPHVMSHFPAKVFKSKESNAAQPYSVYPKYEGVEWPYFEIREIEHSLCEFDKYARCLQGQGRPRQKFAGHG